MIMNVLRCMERLNLMAAYASRVVHNEGLKALNESKVFQPLLRSTFLSTSGDENESMLWSTCTRLDKLIDDRVIYITLVEWSEVEPSPEYSWYELKHDMDKCTAAANIKRKLRDMIKNPQKYISIGY